MPPVPPETPVSVDSTVTSNDDATAPPQVKWPTLGEIRASLPDTCFQPSLARSMFYVFFDFALVAAMMYGQYHVAQQYPQYFWYSYPVFAFMTGTIMWAIFVLGHDCGHGSFSTSDLINDIMGTILHTFILVPFYPWKLSHRHHHQYTGNIDKDEIFHPIRQSDWSTKDTVTQTMKTHSYFMLGLGWFAYLFLGYSTREDAPRDSKSHFSLTHPLFANHQTGVAYSIWSWRIWFFSLLGMGYYAGFNQLALYYAIPLFIFGTWLTVVTFLHHHEAEVELPWFANADWDYVRGNLSSIDRDYFPFHWLTHNIGTHQIHHLFPKIPQYKLIEATQSFKTKFPQFTKESNRNIVATFLDTFKTYASQFVIPDNARYHVYTKKTKDM